MSLAELSRMPSCARNSVFGLSGRPGDLALGCDKNGLHLAGVPLLRRERGFYRPRPIVEITALLSQAYGRPIDAAVYRDGLAAVTNAVRRDHWQRVENRHSKTQYVHFTERRLREFGTEITQQKYQIVGQRILGGWNGFQRLTSWQ